MTTTDWFAIAAIVYVNAILNAIFAVWLAGRLTQTVQRLHNKVKDLETSQTP